MSIGPNQMKNVLLAGGIYSQKEDEIEIYKEKKSYVIIYVPSPHKTILGEPVVRLDEGQKGSETVVTNSPNERYLPSSEQGPRSDENEEHSITDNDDSFEWKLSKEVFRNNANNVVLSPVSVHILLALLAEATGNEVESKTRNELATILPHNQTLDSSRSYFGNIVASLKTPQNDAAAVNIGTRIFSKQSFNLSKKFESILRQNYDAKVVSLKDSTVENSVERINSWVKNTTNCKVLRIVGNVKPNSLLLLNVVYFKGLWKKPFSRSFSGNFFTSSSAKESKEFIQDEGDFQFKYSEDLKLKIIRLPYEGGRFSMLLILPFEADSLDEILKNLSSTMVEQLVSEMVLTNVIVTLPKFKFNMKLKLNDVVKKLGIAEIFKDTATFPNFSQEKEDSKVKVSNIIQSSGIVVDEKGTEAHAATEIEVIDKMAPSDPIQFRADRPFVFFIEDDTTKAMLFSGVVRNPEY